MFLHGGWLHMIGNMWFLWVFGSHIEDAMGAAKFLIFYLISGVASAAVQFGDEPGQPHSDDRRERRDRRRHGRVPDSLSARACGDADLHLLLHHDRRNSGCIHADLLVCNPTAQRLGSIASVTTAQGIAWFAHVGGFLAGVLLIRVFRGKPAAPYSAIPTNDAACTIPTSRLKICDPLDVLAIAAHPDDVEQTCGGTLIRMAERGYRTGVLDLTAGDMGSRGTPEIRIEESQAAAEPSTARVAAESALARCASGKQRGARMTLAGVIRRVAAASR